MLAVLADLVRQPGVGAVQGFVDDATKGVGGDVAKGLAGATLEDDVLGATLIPTVAPDVLAPSLAEWTAKAKAVLDVEEDGVEDPPIFEILDPFDVDRAVAVRPGDVERATDRRAGHERGFSGPLVLERNRVTPLGAADLGGLVDPSHDERHVPGQRHALRAEVGVHALEFDFAGLAEAGDGRRG